MVLWASLSAADTPSAAAASGSPHLTIKVGQRIAFLGCAFTLNHVIPADAKNALGGTAYAEYNLTLQNNSGTEEIRLSDVAVMFGAEKRRVVQSLEEIVQQNGPLGQDNSSMAATALSLLGGMVGVEAGMVGAIATSVGTDAVIEGMQNAAVEVPIKWYNALGERALAANTKDGDVSVYPGDSATGSVWVKQKNGEKATGLNLYIRIGGAPKLVRLELQEQAP